MVEGDDGDDGNGENGEHRHQLRRSNDIDLLNAEKQTYRAVEGLRSEFRSDIRVLKENVKTINKALADNSKLIEDKLVTKEAFNPVKMIAYGFAAATFMAVLGALLATVVQHAK